MKSEHRHDLETNALAKRLDALLHQFRPYASTIAGVVVVLVVVMFIWSYWSGSALGRRDAAWDLFNRSISGANPDLEQLRLAGQEYPGTAMQEMADVTWADGQVWLAARDYIYNRPAALEALSRAIGAYDTVLRTSDDDRLVNRAQLGLARAYEMQGDLNQAREAYLKVRGGYEEYAKLQAERLAEPETKETYAWLATARPPVSRPPAGPGTPGERPDFSEGELALPGADAAASGGISDDAFEKLLQGLKLDLDTTESPETDPNDRYAPGAAPAEEPASTTPQTQSAPPDAQPSDTPPAAESPTSGESTSTETPATDSSTTDTPAADNPTE
jgi:tetratricopeptide (TPR) repeat protein